MGCKNVIMICTDKNAVWIDLGRDKALMSQVSRLGQGHKLIFLLIHMLRYSACLLKSVWQV